jgi:hypothetical protein
MKFFHGRIKKFEEVLLECLIVVMRKSSLINDLEFDLFQISLPQCKQ